MGHFARVENGIVQEVIVAEQEFIDNLVYDKPGEFVKASYNTRGGVHYLPGTSTPSDDQSKALRYNYPGLGWIYSKEADAFYEPKPFSSWTLDTSTYRWISPISKPTDDNIYTWNEENQSWDPVT